MTWTEDLISECNKRGFDLSITLSYNEKGIELYSFSSKPQEGKRVIGISNWSNSGPVAETEGDWFNKFIRPEKKCVDRSVIGFFLGLKDTFINFLMRLLSKK